MSGSEGGSRSPGPRRALSALTFSANLAFSLPGVSSQPPASPPRPHSTTDPLDPSPLRPSRQSPSRQPLFSHALLLPPSPSSSFFLPIHSPGRSKPLLSCEPRLDELFSLHDDESVKTKPKIQYLALASRLNMRLLGKGLEGSPSFFFSGPDCS